MSTERKFLYLQTVFEYIQNFSRDCLETINYCPCCGKPDKSNCGCKRAGKERVKLAVGFSYPH